MSIAPDFIKNISVTTKFSSPTGSNTCRKKASLIIRLTGSMEYIFGTKKFCVNKGEMIFMPKGSCYSYMVKSKEQSKCLIINIDADFDGDYRPMVYPLKDTYCAEYIMNSFSDSWNFGNTADKYKCISYLYELMAYIETLNSIKHVKKDKFRLIEPALDYLKTHIYDVNLRSDELADICGISNPYFRKIFALKFKTNPKNYITEKRLAKAKAMIDCGEFTTVKDLALSVGYEDSLYFGKIFKKHFGIPPATMNKL